MIWIYISTFIPIAAGLLLDECPESTTIQDATWQHHKQDWNFSEGQWWTNNKELWYLLPVVFFKVIHNLQSHLLRWIQKILMKFCRHTVMHGDVVKVRGRSDPALKQFKGLHWWKSSLHNRSKSLQAYQMPKHCLAVYNILRQEFTTLEIIAKARQIIVR